MKGYNQEDIVDYNKTFVDIARLLLYEKLIITAFIHHWLLHQFEIKNVFLNGDFVEEVYIQLVIVFKFTKHFMAWSKHLMLGLKIEQYHDFLLLTQFMWYHIICSQLFPTDYGPIYWWYSYNKWWFYEHWKTMKIFQCHIQNGGLGILKDFSALKSLKPQQA